MSFDVWLRGWFVKSNTDEEKHINEYNIIAIIAGGYIEPARSINALRSHLLDQYQIPSFLGETFSPLSWPPYPYSRLKKICDEYYFRTISYIQKYQNKEFILIGRSFGGLASLYIASQLQRDGLGDHIRRIFTIGSPLYGLRPRFKILKNPFVKKRSDEYVKNASKELRKLTEIFTSNIPREKIINIYSEKDYLLSKANATIRGSKCFKVDAGHLLMIANKETARIISENV